MLDFLLFIMPLSVAGNVALILIVIGDIKKAREKEIRIRSLEDDVWHYRSKKYRKVVRFLAPQKMMRNDFNEDVMAPRRGLDVRRRSQCQWPHGLLQDRRN